MNLWKEDQIVNVSYPDGKGNHQTTIAELRNKWVGETTSWIEQFFERLEKYGISHSNFAEYRIDSPYKIRRIKSTEEIKIGDVLVYTGIPRGTGYEVPPVGAQWEMRTEGDLISASIAIIESRHGWWPLETEKAG